MKIGKIKLIAILALGLIVPLWAADSLEMMRNYDDAGLEALLAEQSRTGSEAREDTAFRLFLVLYEKESSPERIESAALDAVALIQSRLDDGRITAERYYRLAFLHNALIVDAPTWIRYDGKVTACLRKSLELDADYRKARILQIKRRLFSSEGAEEGKILGLLDDFLREYPDEPEALEVYAEYSLMRGDWDGAKNYYERILTIVPNHYGALRKNNELRLLGEKRIIGRIRITGSHKTNLKGVVDELAEREGAVFSPRTQGEIEEILYDIPSVTDVTVRGERRGEDGVDLNLEIGEDNTMVLGILGGAALESDYNNDREFKGYPLSSPGFMWRRTIPFTRGAVSPSTWLYMATPLSFPTAWAIRKGESIMNTA